MLEVVARLGGIHAQVMSAAELALLARVEDLEPDAVASALWQERTLVKTWAMRGTLHLLPAAELSLWITALADPHRAPLPQPRAPEVVRLHARGGAGADRGDRRSARRPRAHPRGARRRRRRRAAARELGLDAQAGRGGGSARLRAGRRARRCASRARSWSPEDPDAALAEMTRRYLGAAGPATREDVARWWGTAPAAGGRMLKLLGDEVAPVTVEGAPMLLLREHVAEAAAAEPLRTVRLLPGFDQYVIAATLHAEALMPGPFKARVHRPQGWISPVLLVGGRMAGVWSHERKGKRLRVEVEPFAPVPKWARGPRRPRRSASPASSAARSSSPGTPASAPRSILPRWP